MPGSCKKDYKNRTRQIAEYSFTFIHGVFIEFVSSLRIAGFVFFNIIKKYQMV